MSDESIHVDMTGVAERIKLPASKVLIKVGTAEDIRAVYKASSKSRPDFYHYVFVFGDGRGVQCTCEGFKFQGRCWHAQSVPLCMAPAPSRTGPTPSMCGFPKDHPGKHDFEYMRK